jgi:hypothetical protein
MVPDLKRYRGVAAILVLLATLLLLPASSIADEPGGEDTAPIITAWRVGPSSLPYQGGQVTIDAAAIDDFGITMAYGEIYGPEGVVESVLLIPSAIDPSGLTTYSGTFNAPPNYTDSPVSYGVEFRVTDTNGAVDTELIGNFEVEAQPQFDEAPIVSDPTVTPRELSADGGPVVIRASASDNRSISAVYATVTLPGGSVEVPMEAISSSEFEGVFVAPANSGATAQEYGIEIIAQDDIGQPGTADAGKVSVAAAPNPPAIGEKDAAKEPPERATEPSPPWPGLQPDEAQGPRKPPKRGRKSRHSGHHRSDKAKPGRAVGSRTSA